jgi:hypothetical protein
MQASERALQEWEDDVAVRRSEGQFFQNLYQTNRKRPVGLSAEQLKASGRGRALPQQRSAQAGWGGAGLPAGRATLRVVPDRTNLSPPGCTGCGGSSGGR